MAGRLVIEAQGDAHKIHTLTKQDIERRRLELFDDTSIPLKQRISLFGRMFALGQSMSKLARKASYAQDEDVFDTLIEMQKTGRVLERLKVAGLALTPNEKTVPLDSLLAFIGVSEEHIEELQRFSQEVLGRARRLAVVVADAAARLGSFLLPVRVEEEGRPSLSAGTVSAAESSADVGQHADREEAAFPTLDFRYPPEGQKSTILIPKLSLDITISGRQAGGQIKPMQFPQFPPHMDQNRLLGTILLNLDRMGLGPRNMDLPWLRSQASNPANVEFCFRTPRREENEPAHFVRELKVSCRAAGVPRCSFTISTAPGGHINVLTHFVVPERN